MRPITLLSPAWLLLASLASASAPAALRRCATPDPTESQRTATRQLTRTRASKLAASDDDEQPFTVNTWFHVIAASESVDDGYLTQKMIDDQLAVLQEEYAPHGISFNLSGTDWTVDASWADDGDELAYKRALRKGPYADLNVYFTRNVAQYVYGRSYFPEAGVAEGDDKFALDGCVVISSSVPGGALAGANLGITTVHEVGHWLNLYHTFQGGCSGEGDQVDDTPAEVSASTGCKEGRDTCASDPGEDPIHNFMDYSDDSCLTEFTAGQKARMYASWYAYRQ